MHEDSKQIVISGTGTHTPPYQISNQELVTTFNTYVAQFNHQHQQAIAAGEVTALRESSSEFIEKASGIKQRYVIEREGILDANIMHPVLKKRGDDEISVQCELALPACQQAMQRANKQSSDIDAVILSASIVQRSYPAVAIEIQKALGINGFAFDMNVACSAATFAIEVAAGLIRKGSARCVLVVNPEIPTAFANFRDRDSHFIFGDVATAMIVETQGTCTYSDAYAVIDSKLLTEFSSNIRTNLGYMTRLEGTRIDAPDQYFYQQGRKVFKEVSILASNLIVEHLRLHGISSDQLQRLWLHQANGNMNQLIAQKILNRKPTMQDAPMILANYANTASAGSIVAFHRYHRDLLSGALGILCSFGAGYSIGNLILRKC